MTHHAPDEETPRPPRADHVGTCPHMPTGAPCEWGCVGSWCHLRQSHDPPRPELALPEPRPGWFSRLRSTVQNRAHEEPS